jgi:uncharacterized MAPEG superfamily protein
MVVSTTTRADLPVQAPKKNRDHVGDSKMSPYMQDRYLRAEAANDNGFVGLPFFAAAVVSGVTRWLYLDSVFGLGRGAERYIGPRILLWRLCQSWNRC